MGLPRTDFLARCCASPVSQHSPVRLLSPERLEGFELRVGATPANILQIVIAELP